jgi:type II secretory pathway pseudopilin PulG
MVKRRVAMTMIELIFAIVLIAIVVAGVPQMLQENANTMVGNLSQENLFKAKRTAVQVLSYPWDNRSIDTSGGEFAYAKVLDVGGGGFARVQDALGNDLPFRIGHIRQDLHRRFFETATAPVGGSVAGWASGGYIPDSGANYAFANAASGGSSNMKIAIITVDEAGPGTTPVTLFAYAANIGEAPPFKRTFQ